MNVPEHGFVQYQGRKQERIPSLDFWRGVFLLMIYVNHIPGNPLAKLTLRNWGFSDSAEPFVFISGFSAMLALGRYFELGGFGTGMLRVLKRAWQLFCAHVILVFALSAIIAAAGDFMDSKPIMEQLNFSPFFVETDIAVVRLLRLGYMPNMTDILPLYIILVIMFPVAWALMRISTFLALCASFSLWLLVNVTGMSFANYPEGTTWFFNPLAWQFLFVAGMAACRERARLGVLLGSGAVFRISVLIAAASALAAAPWTNFEVFHEWRLIPPEFLAIDNKTNLSWIRIIHFLAIAIIAARLFPAASGLWKNRLVRIVSLCGRHSLSTYCAGTVLSFAVYIFLQMKNADAVEAVIMVSSGAAALVFMAMAIQKAKTVLGAVETKTAPESRARQTCSEPAIS